MFSLLVLPIMVPTILKYCTIGMMQNNINDIFGLTGHINRQNCEY